MRVVGECGSPAEVLQLLANAQPGYVVIDEAIAEPSCALLEQMAALRCNTRVVVNGASRDPVRVRSILQAGACGYLVKHGPASQLVDAIAQIEAGTKYVSPLVGACSEVEAPTGEDVAIDPGAVLSEREHEVFLQLGSGARPRDIARSLGLSAKTVDTYRAAILRKLKIDGRAGLVRLASQLRPK